MLFLHASENPPPAEPQPKGLKFCLTNSEICKVAQMHGIISPYPVRQLLGSPWILLITVNFKSEIALLAYTEVFCAETEASSFSVMLVPSRPARQ